MALWTRTVFHTFAINAKKLFNCVVNFINDSMKKFPYMRPSSTLFCVNCNGSIFNFVHIFDNFRIDFIHDSIFNKASMGRKQFSSHTAATIALTATIATNMQRNLHSSSSLVSLRFNLPTTGRIFMWVVFWCTKCEILNKRNNRTFPKATIAIIDGLQLLTILST